MIVEFAIEILSYTSLDIFGNLIFNPYVFKILVTRLTLYEILIFFDKKKYVFVTQRD